MNLRTRLTLIYVSLLAAVLMLYVAGTSAFFLHNVREQLDLALDRDMETVEGLMAVTPDGGVRLNSAEAESGEDVAQATSLLEVWSQSGALLYRSPQLKGQNLGPAPGANEGIHGYSERSSRLASGTRVRIATRAHRLEGRPAIVRLALNEDPLWQDFRELLWVLGIGLPVAISMVGFAGYAIAGRALRPVHVMAGRAEQIGAERLNERLQIENPEDELGHLGLAFNETLCRLERSFEQLRRFTADASHELRTPLTAIRSVGEVALHKSGDTGYYRDVIGSMLEEANRLTRLVDSLLTMSRADAGRIPIQQAEVPVLDLAKESASLLEVLAEEKHQTVEVAGDPSLTVRGDRLILRQALVNLIDNAVKYSPVRGSVHVRVGSRNGEVCVEVQDNGPGIPAEHRSSVFERFYRVDKARTRDEGGTGLGLSIAEWAVGVHGGRIELECEPGPGCTFRVRLPGTNFELRSGQATEKARSNL